MSAGDEEWGRERSEPRGSTHDDVAEAEGRAGAKEQPVSASRDEWGRERSEPWGSSHEEAAERAARAGAKGQQ